MQRRHRPPLQQVEHAKTLICMFPTGGLVGYQPLYCECMEYAVSGKKRFLVETKVLDFANPQTKPRPPSSLQYQAATLDWHVTDRSLALV